MRDRLRIVRTCAPPGTSALVVETNFRDRATMVEWLIGAGYAARGVGSFEAARRILGHGAPEVLISALRLGSFNGFHLIISARAAHPHIRAIIMTPAPDPFAAEYAAELNAACLVAPVTQQALIAAVRQVHA